jgi:hypothetical protein
VLSLSRPNRKTGQYPEVTPEIEQRVGAYNKIDVDGPVRSTPRLGIYPDVSAKSENSIR